MRGVNDPAVLHRQEGKLAEAHRGFARSVLMGLGVLAAIAVIGPLVSYRSDLSVSRSEFHHRVYREASLYAESLWLHLQILEAELERVAQRPEVDLRDNSTASEMKLLQLTHHDSSLFNGVAFLDLRGKLVWSEPADALGGLDGLESRPWFQKVLATEGTAIDALGGRAGLFAVAVPVVQNRRLTGVLVGLIDGSTSTLPGGLQEGEQLLVIGARGDVLFPREVPAWARRHDLGALGQARLEPEGGEWTLEGRDDFSYAINVGTSGLRVLLLANEAFAAGPIRSRLLLQLLFIALLQLSTIVLFSLYLRRTYRGFLAVEARAAEHEKMAALGSAASLIAHEVKNSLNGLNAATSLLASSGAPAPDAEVPIKAIKGQVNRLAHLATSLLSFGKPAGPMLQRVRLDKVALEAVEGISALPESGDVEMSAHLPFATEVKADPLLLVTALDNLIRNAIEAAVAAKDLGTIGKPRVQVSLRDEGRMAAIDVEDNAGGPPADFEARLFVPFATTKPKGIGLGLAMARRAVEQQGGSLSFARTPQGSCFSIRLPTAGEAPS